MKIETQCIWRNNGISAEEGIYTAVSCNKAWLPAKFAPEQSKRIGVLP
jgi:hypothetical protein